MAAPPQDQPDTPPGTPDDGEHFTAKLPAAPSGVDDANAETVSQLPHTAPPGTAPGALRATALAEDHGAPGRQASAPAVPGYEILGELGRGGMGVVYKARHVALKRLVALKMILAGPHAGPAQVARFRGEAEAVARFQHAGIVQIFEVGEHAGLSYCALEFVEGGSLDRHLAGRPQAPDRAAALAEQLARAAHYAHQRGVVHRDLKPANVLVAADGTLKVTDFGLAKQLDGDSGQTQSGQVMGTPSYMAPEQAEGRTDRVGPHTDVYALGAILYEMLTGRVPLKGESIVQTLEMVRTREPAPPRCLNPAVPRDLEVICLTCLRKDPAGRYRSALALAQDLERFAAGEPILARPEGLGRKLARRLRRNRTPLLAALAVAVAVSLAVSVWLGGRQTRSANELAGRVQASLDADAWTPAHVEELDALIARLEPLEPGRAAAARSRVAERYRQALLAELARPRLNPDDVARFRENLAALETRDPAAAADLAGRLKERLRVWEQIAAVAPPFDRWQEVFPAREVSADGRRLAATPLPGWDERGAERIIPADLAGEGDVRVEATFDPSWERATRVGLALSVVRVHAGPVRSVAYAPDGRRFATASFDGTVRLWDTEAGVPERECREASAVHAVAFAPDGARLYTASERGGLGVWDPATGARLSRQAPAAGRSLGLAVSPDGRWLAWSEGNVVHLLERSRLRASRDLPAGTGDVWQLTFAADSRSLAAVTEGRSLQVWDVADARAEPFARELPERPSAIALSADGSLAAAACGGRVLLWERASGRERPGPSPGTSAASLAFGPGGVLFTGPLAWFSSREGWVPRGGVSPTFPAALSSDGGRVASYEDGRVVVRDLATLAELRGLGGSLYSLTLAAPAPLAAPAGEAGAVRTPGETGSVRTLGEARRGGGRLTVQVRRNGVTQQERVVEVAAGRLTVTAKRQGDLLTVQVNQLAPLEFRDPFPLPAQGTTCGVVWPAGVGLERFDVFRQPAPPRLSPLEYGDELFARGRFDEALRQYEAQRGTDPEAARESGYKAGLCLLRLNRLDEAAERFERVAGAVEGRWPALAACQLWLARLRQNRPADAEGVFTALSAQYKPEEVARVAPLEVRAALAEHYRYTQFLGVLFGDEGELARLETAARVGSYLQMDRSDPNWWVGVQNGLARSYGSAGDHRRAVELLRQELAWAKGFPAPDRLALASRLLQGYAWEAALAGEARAVLPELDSWEAFAPGDSLEEVTFRLDVRTERVRLLAAAGDWRAADAEADRALALLRDLPAGCKKTPRWDAGLYRLHSALHMLKGLIRERLGDPAGADVAFRAGARAAWRKTVSPETDARQIPNANQVRDNLAMSAWTGQLGDADAAAALTEVLGHASLGGGGFAGQLAGLLRIPPSVMRSMWLTPRGREVARKCALHEYTHADAVRQPVMLLGTAYALAGAYGEFTDEQEAVTWGLIGDLYRLYIAKKVGQPQCLQAALAWKGTTGLLGWGSLAPKLPPATRAATAYLFGHRSLKLNRPQDARLYFRAAVEDAPAESPVRKLAEQELARLAKD